MKYALLQNEMCIFLFFYFDVVMFHSVLVFSGSLEIPGRAPGK